MLRPIILSITIFAGLVAQSISATSAPQTRAVSVQAPGGDFIPDDAWGVVHIPRVASATLGMLHGKAGRGTMTLRTNRPGHCAFMELRFVAGGFDGNSLAAWRDDPVYLIIRRERVSHALIKGRDIVSDSFGLTDDPNNHSADFLIKSGLSTQNGFVLNPGRNGWSELFGPTVIDVPCEAP